MLIRGAGKRIPTTREIISHISHTHTGGKAYLIERAKARKMKNGKELIIYFNRLNDGYYIADKRRASFAGTWQKMTRDLPE